MRLILILMLVPLLVQSQTLLTVTELETSFSLEAKAFDNLMSKKDFKLSATFKDPIRPELDITMFDKGETSNDYSSIKKTTYNGIICSVEYSSYIKPEHDNLLKQALSMGYSNKNDSLPSFEKGKFIMSTSFFPDFTGRELYRITFFDQTILNKIGW